MCCETQFFHFNMHFSLFFPILSPLSLLSLLLCFIFSDGEGWWPATPPLKSSFFQNFFAVSTSFHPLLLISTLKTFTIQIVNLRSKKRTTERNTFLPFGFDFEWWKGTGPVVPSLVWIVGPNGIVVAVICATDWLFAVVTVLVVVWDLTGFVLVWVYACPLVSGFCRLLLCDFSVFFLWLFVLLFCVQVFGFYSIRFVAKGLLKEQIKVALDWNEENALCFCSWVCVADEANSDWTPDIP